MKCQSEVADGNEYVVNLFVFIGHGIINDQKESIFLINTKSPESVTTDIEMLNVDQLANEFSELKNTINIFVFAACRIRDNNINEESKEND